MGVTARDPSPSASRPQVLVVVDESQLVRALRIVLRDAGFIVEVAPTSRAALGLLAERPPDVLVLDLVVPDGGGVEVCREVRRFSQLPIVIMSAAGDERQTVCALEAGADECVIKPFRGTELLAGLRRVLSGPVDRADGSRVEIGDLVIDFARRRVSRAGVLVLLAPEEFELVSVLAQRQGRLVTDRQLLRAVWGTEQGRETHWLRAGIARIRAKLEREPGRPKYLVAEPGIGYRLASPGEALR